MLPSSCLEDFLFQKIQHLYLNENSNELCFLPYMKPYLVELFQVVSDGRTTLYGFHCLMKLLPGVLSVVIRQFRSVCKSRQSQWGMTSILTVIYLSINRLRKCTSKDIDKEHRNQLSPIQSFVFISYITDCATMYICLAKYICIDTQDKYTQEIYKSQFPLA